MGSEYPWFPCYVADWVMATRGLTPEARGIYMDLLCFAWDGPGLPTDPAAIQQMVGCTPVVWRRVWASLRSKWIERDGRLVNPRQEDVRAEVMRHQLTQSERGRKGAQARWRQSPGTAQALPEQSLSNGISQSQPQSDPHEDQTQSAVAPLRAGAFDLTHGQLRASAPGLFGAWNNIARGAPPLKPFDVDPPVTGLVLNALRARPSIETWAAIFDKVAASDFLRGMVPNRDGTAMVADFWWVLDHAAQIEADRYINRSRKAQAPPAPRPDVPRPSAWQALCAERGHEPPCALPSECERKSAEVPA